MMLDQLTWKEAGKLEGYVFLVPLGSLEQHGPHLPLVTDTAIVSAVSERIEARHPGRVILLPTQWLGHSPHHRRFACVSLDVQAYIGMICGICRSLVTLGAQKILLLNGHGGNDIPCKAALRGLKSEYENRPDVYIAYTAYWSLAAREFAAIRTSPPGGMGHAGEMETSVMLALHPDSVRTDKAAADGPFAEGPLRVRDLIQSQPYYIVNEFDEISRNGAIGMPEHASREKGEQFLEAAVKAAGDFIREFSKWRYQEDAAKRRG